MSKETEKNNPKDLATGEIVEDVLGLDMRGLKSIYALWVKPREYFQAAKQANWNNIYTPSVRLWLFFFALFSVLKFWWLENNPAMIGAYIVGFEEARLTEPEGVSFEEIAQEMLQLTFAILPFLQIAVLGLLSFVYPFWGRPLSRALRQRYFFAIMIPSASLMPVLLTGMVFITSEYIELYSYSLALTAFLLHFMVSYRGVFYDFTLGKRLFLSGLMAFVVVALSTLLGVVTQIGGIVYISMQYGLSP
ncbi:hypothetical protein QGN29_10685 [Temperatibacter marinus]|uniref:DUF3667 domain-containing protein n=1 Tax=Temperatibacter marinus TaxID=1456591 RepID=A0AA52EAZ8_9PROT|nr:hypothetical protein [Temperatibacter marinus]WND02012.1 hypothetical protein QGN29_10685 [Temperatibacter marinus]